MHCAWPERASVVTAVALECGSGEGQRCRLSFGAESGTVLIGLHSRKQALHARAHTADVHNDLVRFRQGCCNFERGIGAGAAHGRYVCAVSVVLCLEP